jgi:hypothetical protein
MPLIKQDILDAKLNESPYPAALKLMQALFKAMPDLLYKFPDYECPPDEFLDRFIVSSLQNKTHALDLTKSDLVRRFPPDKKDQIINWLTGEGEKLYLSALGEAYIESDHNVHRGHLKEIRQELKITPASLTTDSNIFYQIGSKLKKKKDRLSNTELTQTIGEKNAETIFRITLHDGVTSVYKKEDVPDMFKKWKAYPENRASFECAMIEFYKKQPTPPKKSAEDSKTVPPKPKGTNEWENLLDQMLKDVKDAKSEHRQAYDSKAFLQLIPSAERVKWQGFLDGHDLSLNAISILDAKLAQMLQGKSDDEVDKIMSVPSKRSP